MRNTNWNEVQESNRFAKPTAGGYLCRIVKVEDVPLNPNTGRGDYTKIFYDIADGDFKNFYQSRFDSRGWEFPSFIRSYKDKALGMYKHLLRVVEDSNQGRFSIATFDNDERKLVGMNLGIVLGLEEYAKQDCTKAVRLYVDNVISIAELEARNYQVPDLKLLSFSDQAAIDDATDHRHDVASGDARMGDEECPF